MVEAVQPLVDYVRRYVALSDEEADIFRSFMKLTPVRRRQYLVQPGYVCHYQSYILRGAFRTYLLDEAGHAHTIGLSIEDWWLSDYDSFINQKPATLFVEALEEGLVVQLHHDSVQELYRVLPQFERFFRIIGQRSIIFLQRRMLASMSQRAEQRYADFIELYPGIAQRVPQYALASYLGITTEFLSKIRGRKTGRSAEKG